LSVRAVQVALIAAGIGAVVILLQLFGRPVQVAALVIIVLAALITAPAGRRYGGRWWPLLVLGAVLSVGGALIAQGPQALGGLIALIGGIIVIIAAAIGVEVVSPAEEADASSA
jgi:hypothetical protein